MKEKIRVAYIGLGRRGIGVLKKCISEMPDVEIKVLCDRRESALQKAAELFLEKGVPIPELSTDAKASIERPDIDAVFIMTGWAEHGLLAEQSMQAGKYTAIEVGCVFDLEECFRLIKIYEETKSPLMMLENCCYGRREMMALNLRDQGLFGEIVHCAGGYLHYLPKEDLFKDMIDRADGENHHYRLPYYLSHNCEQYPTHELGPIAKVLRINRGNRFVSLSSFASKAAGLKEAAKRHLGEGSPYAEMNYIQGDIITTVLTCAGGETVQLTLDTTLPRPYYSRGFEIRGTKGGQSEEGKCVFLEGMQEPIRNNEEEMFEKYDHPLHREYHALGERGGHGGMDWLVCRAFIESVKRGEEPPIDAYDSVTLMAIAALSEESIKRGGAPVEFPDFTNGKWKDERPCNSGKYSLDKIVEDPKTPIFPKK